MTSPTKPWERSDGDSRPNGREDGYSSGKAPHRRGNSGSPPPIPTRSSAQGSRAAMGFNSSGYGGGMNSGYGSMYGGGGYGMGYNSSYGGGYGSGMGGYGSGMGGYGSGMGGYGYGMNRMGYGNSMQAGSSFARTAEETSQPAFDSIMSVVQAFGSISQMLESTFFAVHSSFRAVLGVADQFSSLKLQLLNTLGAFTFLRTLRYIIRKLMILLRLRRYNPNDDMWNAAAENVMDRDVQRSAKAWPLVLFLTVIFGTPWLIWKFIQLMAGEEAGRHTTWIDGIGEHYEARAEYDFEAEGNDELSFQAGAILRIAPKGKQPRIRGWLLASNGKTSGIVPANYVKILGRRSGRQSPSTGEHLTLGPVASLDAAYNESNVRRMQPHVSDFDPNDFSSDSSPTD